KEASALNGVDEHRKTTSLQTKVETKPCKKMLKPKKHLERYHANNTLVKDMTEREPRSAERKWKNTNKKRRKRQICVAVLPTARNFSSRGRRQIRRDRSTVHTKI
ncbi:hypothetical protein HHI36_011158, partial [Cryptolaemus montrouzieri]